MNRTASSVTAGLIALLAVTPSLGAERVARSPYTRAPSYEPYLAPFTWQGFYATFSTGYGWAESGLSDTSGTSSTVNPRGGLLGSGFGYNFQTGKMVFGVEGDSSYSWMSDTNGTSAPCSSCEVRNHYIATLRGRVGYAWDRWLPYITGGAAFGDIDVSIPTGGSQATNKVGWTAGAGVEYAFSATNWSMKFEYLYVDLGTATCDAAHCGTSTNADFQANIVRLGVNYRF